MKKIILFFVFTFSMSFLQAQRVIAWMDAGVKVGYGLTGLINTNLFDDRDYEHHLTGGFGVGAKVGLFFGLYNGVTCDFLISGINQKFDFNRNGTNYLHDFKLKSYDIALMYRSQKSGVYVELGPQYSIVSKVEHDDNFPGAPNGDVSKYYVEKYFSGVFGLGGYIFNYETFTTMIGFRLGYGFQDIVNADGKAFNKAFPTPSIQTEPTAHKSTNPAWIKIMIEANFALGYYGKSSCSKRATFFNF